MNYDSRSSSNKPCGNSYSLVPEIANRGVKQNGVKPASHGEKPKIEHSTMLRNNSSTNLSGTGKS